MGHPEVEYVLPAQSPQNVVSKMNVCSLKWLSMSQPPAKLAVGMPNLDVSGLSELSVAGMAPRGKNHILMADEVHSIA